MELELRNISCAEEPLVSGWLLSLLWLRQMEAKAEQIYTQPIYQDVAHNKAYCLYCFGDFGDQYLQIYKETFIFCFSLFVHGFYFYQTEC